VNPELKEVAPYLNFAPLLNALADLETASEGFVKAWGAYFSGTQTLDKHKRAQLNQVLYQAEQTLIREEGLPRRPWFRHQVYAPGFYTGYGVKTFPGVREAIEERKWSEAEEQVMYAAQAILEYTAQVEKATRLLAIE
jgi:N-acetylated-alpha-linked acidic dipeptidase